MYNVNSKRIRMDDKQLVLRKRKYHRQSIYWVGRIVNGQFMPYSDMLGPTGYGHRDREVAQEIMREIEERRNARSANRLRNMS